ncbi:MAG: T9SS C-terminal target domain-containing protein [Bacteroidia bacterium]|nr:MAG: T9SS C-terminal target domain-containing protein [Bacteroidia bacterium]
MKRTVILFVILVAGMFSYANAQANWVGINQQMPVPADTRLVFSNIQETQIQFSVDGYLETPLRTPNGTEMRIGINGGFPIMEKGMPDLAKLTTTIIIPDYDEMQVNVTYSKYHEFTGVEVAPSKGHFTRDIRPDDVPFTYGEAYGIDAFWPGTLAQLEDPFVMRDFRGQTVTIFPYQYNPVTQTLRVYTDIVVEVTSTGKQGIDPLTRTRDIITIEPEFGHIYNRFFLNMESASKSYPMLEGEEGSMLIIAYDAFMDAMQPFINWKRTIGRRVEMVAKSEAGNTAAAIKNFVSAYYDDNEDFAYLLLIGDGPQIPPMVYGGNHSDNAYGFLVGSNAYNDIFVGRFSAETVAHVETQVQRMIQYERDLDETDTWLARAQGVARNEGTGSGHHGEGDHQHMDFIKDTLLNFTYEEVFSRYDGPGFSTSAALISGDINSGVSAINFCNHGSVTGWSVAGYNISHVNQLTNVGKLPYITSVACVNGNFVNNFCFAEAWMRATHNGEPTGAVGIMAATINQPWQPPMCGQDEMVSIKTEASIPHGPVIKRTYGGVSINGSMFMIPQYGATGINTHATWILFGDPTLMVRTAAPQPFSATYNPVILLGLDSFEITIPDAEGAVVAITQYDEIEDEVIILGTAIVEGGTATVHFDEPPTEPGVLTLAITGFNMVTYINDEIQVIPPDGPYVVFNQFVIDDSHGNNNNQADYGEYIILDMSLKNVGIELAEAVEATLTTDSEYITIANDFYEFGDIADNESVMMEEAFSFQIEDVIPNNHNVIFTLHMTDAEGNEWESNFALRIYSPMFQIGEFWVDDSEHGDDNGRLDPGETASIMIEYTNTGGAPAMAPVSSFFAANPYLTIHDYEIEHEIILAGETVQVAYTVEAHPSALQGTFVDVHFSVEDAHHFDSQQLLIIGQTPDAQLGEGTLQSNQYPFYNYYRANRSQMLYTAAELGAGEKTITELAFEIINASTSHNQLPNFYIRMMHTTSSVLTNFINTANAVEVYHANPYTMPMSTGWHHWELQEYFEYNGEDNLLVEVVWGSLPNWTSNFYRVASTNVGANRVAYGFSDWNDIPPFSGTSAVRPNLWLAFAAEATDDVVGLSFVILGEEEEALENAVVRIGSMDKFTDEVGTVSYTLLPGNYHYTVTKESYLPHVDSVELEEDTVVEVNMLLETFPVTFNVNLSRAIEFNLLENFNPNGHHIMITGDMVGWAAPGEKPDKQIMEQISEDPPIYSITHHLVPGEYFYKYFSDAIGEGWDGGEWPGDPNRYIEIIDTELIIDEMFGPDDLSVVESGEVSLTLFPNPARTMLNMRSNEDITNVRIVDILGQVVYSQSISGATHHEIDVSGFRTGIYMVQVTTTRGVVTHRVQVTR